MGHRSPSKQCPLPAACGRWGWRPTLREPSGQTNTVRCKVHCSKTLCQTSQCPSLWILSAGAEPAKRGVTYTTRSAPRTPRIAPDEAAQPALKRHFPACCEQRVVRFLCYRTVTGEVERPSYPVSQPPTNPPQEPAARQQLQRKKQLPSQAQVGGGGPLLGGGPQPRASTVQERRVPGKCGTRGEAGSCDQAEVTSAAAVTSGVT